MSEVNEAPAKNHTWMYLVGAFAVLALIGILTS